MSTSVKPDQTTLLVVDDDSGQRDLLASFLRTQEFRVLEAASGLEALELLGEQPVHMIVSDVRMPGMTGIEMIRQARAQRPALPFLMVTAYADVRDAVDVMRDGAFDYLEKPIDFEELNAAVCKALGMKTTHAPPSPDNTPPLPEGIVAESAAMRTVLRETALVAPTESRVLITGESGTGKEIVADLIHRWSKRTAGPLVKVNCAAIPENLLESELFGHEKGSFTGAVSQRIGRFEEAGNGTLFLDEIGEMSAPLQAKLLRVIQDGEFERVGSNRTQTSNARIVTATNCNLEKEIEECRFREDLFFRLNVFEIYIPPLRERREDILPLAEQFATRYSSERLRPRLSASTVAALALYRWPGNVRELQNAMERATLMARGGGILPEHLPRRVRQAMDVQMPDTDDSTKPAGRIEEMERVLILQTLKEQDYNRSKTARVLGISRRALLYKLRQLADLGYKIDA
ncbi:MAG: sigma-54-dependent Fis family transcriptional regulator [Lentisphaeria bacterium]|nr:sigma-54-dependent Fis family transcriptional regulator [Lentisphaeria bacterium]